jgi:hypothetical protein
MRAVGLFLAAGLAFGIAGSASASPVPTPIDPAFLDQVRTEYVKRKHYRWRGHRGYRRAYYRPYRYGYYRPYRYRRYGYYRPYRYGHYRRYQPVYGYYRPYYRPRRGIHISIF